jgi:AcrR family transcriptional regulator
VSTEQVSEARRDGARASRLPRDQRRVQLLDAASEVFTTRGYHAAAMDDIAETAGVSKPVLYQHFGSKLELYLALLDSSCDSLVEVVEEAIGSTDANADRVFAAMGAFYEFVSSASGEFRFVFESDLTGDGEVQKRLWRVNDEIADAIAEVISEDTALPPEQAKLLGISLVGIAQVSARYWVSAGPDKVSLEDAKQLVSTLAWRGIRGFPRTEHVRMGSEHPKLPTEDASTLTA